MSATERRKGATYERELAREAQAHGFLARRGGHRQVQEGDDAGDVVEIPPLFIEAKRHERLSLPAWLRQVRAACPAGLVPAVVFRRSFEKSTACVPWLWLLAEMEDARRWREHVETLEAAVAWPDRGSGCSG